jgi:hypothetical protein
MPVPVPVPVPVDARVRAAYDRGDFPMSGRRRRSRVFVDPQSPDEGSATGDDERDEDADAEDADADDESADDESADDEREEEPEDAQPAPDASGDDVPRVIEVEGDWVGAMPDAQTLAVADKQRAFDLRRARPSAGMRWIVILQLGLVLGGAAAWWGLLHLGVNASALEIAWFLAAGVGVILLVSGHLRRLTWQTVFGGVTSAGPLLFQMRGADLLLGYGLTTFNALLAAMLAVSGVLAVLSVREIDAVA